MIKRLSDILISVVFILLLAPLLIGIALFILIDSKGGVLFKQVRVGLNGQEFEIFKFRTMFTDSEKMGQLTIGGRDPRVTKVGYILRKYKFDELPQFFNVLNGDMSIVGPRPEVWHYVNMYTAEQQKVLSVKPGITDYASIEYSNENELLSKSNDPEKTYIEEIMPTKLALNLKYIRERSLAVDLKIMWQTAVKIIG